MESRKIVKLKVKKIRQIQNENVYDITTLKNHNFFANNILVHNCCEIPLADGENCNLAELYLNNIENKKELFQCAKLLYKTQKATSALTFLHKKTNDVVHKNMKLGLGVTGICQCSDEKLLWLDDCYVKLREFDKKWSKENEWPESIRLTTTKPSGSLSLLSGSTPGVHPAYAKYYIRRVRMASNDPMVVYCKDRGFKTEYVVGFDGAVDHNTTIVEFPCQAENSILAKDMNAVKQLETVKKIQTIWADNAVSCTVYYKKEELEEIKAWLKENYENSIKSVSFLLHNEHGFKQAPYEEITKDQYEELRSGIKEIISLNDSNGFDLKDSVECAGGSCPIK